MNTPARDPGPAIEYAAQYLERAGLTILDRDWHCADGAISIIADDHGVLVACEVRTRKRPGSGSLAGTVSRARIALLRRLAVRWQNDHHTRYERLRADVIRLTGDGPGEFTAEHVREAG